MLRPRLLEILLDRKPRPHLGRHVQPGGGHAAHGAGRVDDHLGCHDVVGLRGIERVDWNGASISAFGRVLHHVAFATHLKATKPGLALRDLLTAFARKEDIVEGATNPKCARTLGSA